MKAVPRSPVPWRVSWAHTRPRLCSRAHPGRIGVLACALAARAGRYCLVVLICGVYRRGRLYAQESSPSQQVNESQRILALDLGWCYFNAMKLFLLSLLFAASCLCAETDTNLYDRVFFIKPSNADLLTVTVSNAPPLSSEEIEESWKKYYRERHHIPWPNGAKIVFFTEPHCCLYVCNTKENLSKIECSLKLDDVLSGLQYSFDLELIAFKKKDIEHLQATDKVTKDSLLALQKQGRSKSISFISAPVPGNYSVDAKYVQEVSYPSEYESSCILTNQLSPTTSVLLPASYTMREAGVTLSLVFENSSDDGTLFYISGHLDYCAIKGWTEYDGVISMEDRTRRHTCKQPLFQNLRLDVRACINIGETILLGGGASSEEGWIYYAFLSVHDPTSSHLVNKKRAK